MNLEKLHEKLIAAARKERVADEVPYAFEKRIMARLKSAPPVDAWAVWGRALWRSAASCAVVALLSASWVFFSGPSESASDTLAQEFEDTVFAVVDNSQAIVEVNW